MVFTVCGDVAQDFGLGGVSWRLKPHQQLQSPPSRTNPPQPTKVGFAWVDAISIATHDGRPWFLPFAGMWHKILDWVE